MIDSLLAKEPGLEYYGNTGHFTFYSLLKTNPDKAVEFAEAWLAANDEPRFKTITDSVTGREGLPPEMYRLAAKSYQEHLDRYPWSMDFPKTYKEMSELYAKAGDKAMAEDMRKKAES